MEFELRSVLLVVGVVVIAAILIHGLVGIRKANKPVDLSGIDLRDEDPAGNPLRDGSGFDRHGVGVARVVRDDGDEQFDSEEVLTPQLTIDDAQMTLDIPDVPGFGDNVGDIDFDVALDTQTDNVGDDLGTTQVAADDLEADGLTIEEPASPVFDSPVYREKPLTQVPEEYREHQQQLDLEPVEADSSETEPAETESVDIAEAGTEAAETSGTTENKATAKSSPVIEPMDVLVLNVVGGDDNELNGAQLLPLLLTLGFKFGDMDIFHRHADSSGHGEVLFSLANMVKPGVFDLDNMEQFTTSGVSLFMTLPHNQGNLKTFNMMLNAAAKIAEEFAGQVLDGNRSTLTKQSTQHYVERIREVERKLLLNK